MDQPRGTDLTRTRSYREQYQYDPTGNLTRLQHQAGSTAVVRELSPAPASNRLATVTIGQSNFGYTHDANGNVLAENSSRHFEWDYADRMRVFRTQAGNAEPSVHAHYLYDASGERVKKLVRKQGGQVEVSVYVDDIFEYQRQVQGGATQQNNTLHVMDNKSRIAVVRVGSPFQDDTTPAVKYHLADHLGSSNVVLDDTGALVNREEYTPYGETSFGNFAKKRYRFTGKERDEESGLYYHGARYYAPWLGRWASADPEGMVDGPNLYRYVRNNPLKLTDPSGTEATTPKPDASAGKGNASTADASDTKSNASARAPLTPDQVARLKNFHTPRVGKATFYSCIAAKADKCSPHFVVTHSGGRGAPAAAPTPGAAPKSGAGSLAPQPGVPTAPPGSPIDQPPTGGTSGTSGTGGSESTGLDKVVEIAGHLNFESTSKDGVSGGIPGGMGPKENASKIGQVAYAAVSFVGIVDLLRSVARIAVSIARAAVRGIGRMLGNMTERLLPRSASASRLLVQNTMQKNFDESYKMFRQMGKSHDEAIDLIKEVDQMHVVKSSGVGGKNVPGLKPALRDSKRGRLVNPNDTDF